MACFTITHSQYGGTLLFPQWLLPVVQSRPFQRLYGISQLGAAAYTGIVPLYSRAEHSLGVAHLALRLVEQLRTRQPALGISDLDVRCVTIAGLLHDIGHAPCSHDAEGLREELGVPDWTHEEQSVLLLAYVPLSRRARRRVAAMIRGAPEDDSDDSDGTGETAKRRSFLYEIVHNKRTGFDVDRWDYLERDEATTAAQGSTGLAELLLRATLVTVTDGISRLSHRAYAIPLIAEALRARVRLHSTVSRSPRADGATLAWQDAVLASRRARRQLQRAWRDPVAFLTLTDATLAVKAWQPYACVLKISDSSDSSDQWAPSDPSDGSVQVIANAITEQGRAHGFARFSHVRVKRFRTDHGLGDANPLDHMHFVGPGGFPQPWTAFNSAEELGLPARLSFAELRVYSTTEPRCKQVQTAAVLWASGDIA